MAMTNMESHCGPNANLDGMDSRLIKTDTGFKTIDAKPGMVGVIIETDVYGYSDYYTADFRESGGMVTDCHAIELQLVH
jgi:hypothetical protein